MAKRRPAAGTPNPWPARLKRLREEQSLTQQEAADKVRISRRAWVTWETGVQVPSPAHQLLIELLEKKAI